MQSYRCWAEVDLDALRENLAWLRHRVGPEIKIMTVVKADAYGHGLKQIAALLMQSGTDIFGVANLAEAQAIRGVGRGWPILMLGACLPHEVSTAVRDGVMPTISSLEEAEQFSAEATRHRKIVDVHLKVDTGMGRLGARPDAAVKIAQAVSMLPGIRLQGVFTHFSSAEDDGRFTWGQENRFRCVLEELSCAGVAIPVVHASNSAALLHQRTSRYNLVRPGLLVYGIVPAGRRRAPITLRRQLRPALSWKARVAFVKEVPAATPLSYGHTFVTPTAMRIATVTVGYGDGYSRAGSNRAEVLIRGRRCRVLGRVTMDQLLVDVSRARAPKPGDEVVLIGRQGRGEITVHDLASWFGTIPWEVLTAITYRVPRIYKGASAA